MYKTAHYTLVNGDVQKATHLKQQKSLTVTLLGSTLPMSTCQSELMDL